MNIRIWKTGAALLGICGMLIVNGCGASEQNAAQNGSENTEETGGTQTENEAASGQITSLGAFSLEDLAGKQYTQEMFGEYELTMVNIFTTWCTPCVNEIPDLEKLHTQMADSGVNVVGIVLDAIDEKGNKSEETVEKAKLLAERTGATYPFLIPDAGGLNGRLYGIDAVPETFFVDKNGSIVGDTYSGSRSFDAWMEIVTEELAGIKGGQQ